MEQLSTSPGSQQAAAELHWPQRVAHGAAWSAAPLHQRSLGLHVRAELRPGGRSYIHRPLHGSLPECDRPSLQPLPVGGWQRWEQLQAVPPGGHLLGAQGLAAAWILGQQ